MKLILIEFIDLHYGVENLLFAALILITLAAVLPVVHVSWVKALAAGSVNLFNLFNLSHLSSFFLHFIIPHFQVLFNVLHFTFFSSLSTCLLVRWVDSTMYSALPAHNVPHYSLARYFVFIFRVFGVLIFPPP